MATLLKSINPKKVIGNMKEALRSLAEEGDSVLLLKCVGAVKGFRVTEPGVNGEPGIAFKAAPSIEAINCITGEMFKGKEIFLPDTLKDELLSVMEKTDEPIEFGLSCTMIRDDSIVAGYQLRWSELIEQKVNNPISHLTGLLTVEPVKSPVALEAPKATEDAPAVEAPKATEDAPAVEEAPKAKGKAK